MRPTRKPFRVFGSTFTGPDPDGQRIQHTDGARKPGLDQGDVRPLRTYQKGVGGIRVDLVKPK